MSTTKRPNKLKTSQQKIFIKFLVEMESSRPPSSRPMSRRGAFGANEMSSASSGRIGTASRLSSLSAMPNRLGTAKNIGIPQKVIKCN